MKTLMHVLFSMIMIVATVPSFAQDFEAQAAYGPSQTILCESQGYRYNSCAVNGYIHDVRIVSQQSKSACIYGSSWGYDRNYIWVDQGCRAYFEVRSGGYGGQQISCASQGYRYQLCTVGYRIYSARLISQQSKTACIYGSTWGYTYDGVWVDRGCRGTFLIE